MVCDIYRISKNLSTGKKIVWKPGSGSATPCLPECPALNTGPERLSLPLDHRVLVLRFESLDGVLHHNLEIGIFFLLLSDVCLLCC
jgi:hypothetical protein